MLNKVVVINDDGTAEVKDAPESEKVFPVTVVNQEGKTVGSGTINGNQISYIDYEKKAFVKAELNPAVKTAFVTGLSVVGWDEK